MPEKEQKNKSGAGKFFLGATLGAIAGAIASKFIDIAVTKDDGEPVEDDHDLKQEKKTETKTEAKKPASKK